MAATVAPPHHDTFARRLSGCGPVGLTAMTLVLAGNLLFIPLSALLVLLWRHLSGTPWREIGFVRPRSWVRAVLLGTGFGIAFKLIMKALVMPLLGAPPLNQRYHFLVGNSAALPLMLYLVIIGAGFGEETVFRGFLFERLRCLLGSSRQAIVAIVVMTALFFGALHYREQGLPGVQQATIVGLVYGTIYARSGALPLLMIAHAAFDLMALALIYWNLEYQVAHWIFR